MGVTIDKCQFFGLHHQVDQFGRVGRHGPYVTGCQHVSLHEQGDSL